MIIYCGALWPGSTSLMRKQALERLGHKVLGIDTTYRPRGLSGLMYRVARKAGYLVDAVGTNSALTAALSRNEPEVVWIDKGLTIDAHTLRETLRCKAARLIHYSPDDMGRKHNQSTQYLECIPEYHLHVTTKSFNVEELRLMGARSVVFVNNAYCPLTHRPQHVDKRDASILGGPVGFIGAFEKERAEAIWSLVIQGVPVRVWGEGWGSGWTEWAAAHRHPGLKVEGRALFGPDYATAICSFDVNLTFLRKINRDLQTTRSVEIPACGAFMLAERTLEQQQLFQEGVEADFFSNSGELAEKCRYYLSHPEIRNQVARAGRERCVRSDYSYDHQLRDVLQCVNRETLRIGSQYSPSRSELPRPAVS